MIAGTGAKRVPPLDGATAWLNSGPIRPAELRGRVILVDFCTFTCINWLRQEPHVRAWSRAYGDDGLVVIGVHTPEFSFEHDLDSVARAMEERQIDYPVAIDNDHRIWRAFENRYWPALYFVDVDGVIRDRHFGEGRYEESERLIQRLVGVDREHVAVEAAGVEAAADWDNLRSPEVYLGHGRRERSEPWDDPSSEARASYEFPARLRLNEWALAGEWAIGHERALLDGTGGTIAIRFHARDAHLVLSRVTDAEIPFRVLLDGEAPGPSRGVDVDENGRGEIGDGRLYQLIRVREAVRERTVEVEFLEAGAEAYAFTFG